MFTKKLYFKANTKIAIYLSSATNILCGGSNSAGNPVGTEFMAQKPFVWLASLSQPTLRLFQIQKLLLPDRLHVQLSALMANHGDKLQETN